MLALSIVLIGIWVISGVIICIVGSCGHLFWATILLLVHTGCAIGNIFIYDYLVLLGGYFTGATGIALIFLIFSNCTSPYDIDEVKCVRITFSLLAGVNFALMSTAYLKISDYLAFGISCTVLLVVAVINSVIFFYVTHRHFKLSSIVLYDVINIAFATVSAGGLIAGYSIYAVIGKGVSVETDCVIYRYDNINAQIGEKTDSLFFNEYYAFQVNFEWNNMIALSSKNLSVQITISFPEAIEAYISDGLQFNSGNDKKVWEYSLTLSTKSEKTLESGIFVFKYDYDLVELPLSPVKIEVKSTDTSEIFSSAEYSYSYNFIRKAYSFGEGNVVKDLAYADGGHYRLIIPEGCGNFRIKLSDENNSGVYYTATVDASGEYYLLDIYGVLEATVEESVLNRIKQNNEKLSIEVTAVGNRYYEEAVYEFLFSPNN